MPTNNEEYQGWSNSKTWNVNWLIDQDRRANDFLSNIRKQRKVCVSDIIAAFALRGDLRTCEKWVKGKTNWQEIADFWNDRQFN